MYGIADHASPRASLNSSRGRHSHNALGRQTGAVRRSDEREAAEMLRRLLDAVYRGELTADTPAERRNVRRLEGMLAALDATEAPARPVPISWSR
jgi:hypothetical protein